MTKDQFLDLTDWDLVNWIGRPSCFNDAKKPYWPAPRVDTSRPEGTPITWRDMYMMSPKAKAMKTMGATEEELEAEYQNWISDHVSYRRPDAQQQAGLTISPEVQDGG